MDIGNHDDIFGKLQTLTKEAVKAERHSTVTAEPLPTVTSTLNKRPGRPAGTKKRKGGTSKLTIPLTIEDKRWVQNAAQARGMSMTEFMTTLINEKRQQECSEN